MEYSDQTIKFYKAQGPYGFLSNFSRHAVTIEGKRWPTTEHYFQGQKFAGKPQEEVVRRALTPFSAKKLGGARSSDGGPLRKDWPKVKEEVMYTALQAKFTQHQDLREKLLATGNAVLVEHTNKDSYWGDGGNGSGLNRLGALLVQLRETLRKTPNSAPSPIATSDTAPIVTSDTAPIADDADDQEEYSGSDNGTNVNDEAGDDDAGDDGGDEGDDLEENVNRDGSIVTNVLPTLPTIVQKTQKKKK